MHPFFAAKPDELQGPGYAPMTTSNYDTMIVRDNGPGFDTLPTEACDSSYAPLSDSYKTTPQVAYSHDGDEVASQPMEDSGVDDADVECADVTTESDDVDRLKPGQFSQVSSLQGFSALAPNCVKVT